MEKEVEDTESSIAFFCYLTLILKIEVPTEGRIVIGRAKHGMVVALRAIHFFNEWLQSQLFISEKSLGGPSAISSWLRNGP